ncbi:low molecular weight phosphotyrosine protein phosphatase [Chryseobacterium indologenes]|uniref:protein-tyrosine-phosphatase n=1 Tax=Chryseobacterium indologenes TaxID=253 RepID=A0AAD0YSU8_CHRID|nr:low molecular weight protein-tyrosine-phosphatase [Chryseobacterium indologenes]ASE60455.1 low molecular weight phosphotyrosine protein phosphatase [Chryseobacterium indologenes]AYZ36489.1 low molecular weight phosphotyrosine protein phosphatase [Chryseobacterium indologenes]AZB16281.1 low molecular weight phosphotyrosine protein phosphatase [Chryseobacterium indologenes]MBF6645169.1 low molecular weight phosphotyrosine protein phosphatase [Chryseobacterium indologenes]MBU3046921.1 low mole
MRILMVCLGNICRSPLAEGIMKTKLPEGFEVDSAGTISMHEGEHPDKRAIKTAANHDIDISRQRSRPIIRKDFETFDKIYCMDIDVLEDVISKTKNEEERQKVSLFLEALGDHKNAEVPDPYWGDMRNFEEVFQLLDKGCNAIRNQIITS